MNSKKKNKKEKEKEKERGSEQRQKESVRVCVISLLLISTIFDFIFEREGKFCAENVQQKSQHANLCEDANG